MGVGNIKSPFTTPLAAGAGSAQGLGDALEPHRTRGFDEDDVAGPGKFLDRLGGRLDFGNFHDAFEAPVARRFGDLARLPANGRTSGPRREWAARWPTSTCAAREQSPSSAMSPSTATRRPSQGNSRNVCNAASMESALAL